MIANWTVTTKTQNRSITHHIIAFDELDAIVQVCLLYSVRLDKFNDSESRFKTKDELLEEALTNNINITEIHD